MATSLFYVYAMATSFFYFDIYIDIYIVIYIDVYIDIYFDIYIYKLTERPVVLLNAIFASLIESTALKDIDGGNCP